MNLTELTKEQKKQGLTQSQKDKCFVTLGIFKTLIPEYQKNKENPETHKIFLSLMRSPIFDITNTKFWKTGLRSESAKHLIASGETKGNSKLLTTEHFIPRTIAMGYVMDEICANPEMDVDVFVSLIKKYGGTIVLSSSEHTKVTTMARNTGRCNYVFYNDCKIIVDGLEDYIKNQGLFEIVSKKL